MDRRAFFKSVGKMLAESIIKEKERPPGALPESEFLDTCTGCDSCMAACPHNLIYIEDLEKRAPIIYPETEPCLLCEGFPCISICPTGALKSPA